MMREGWNDIGYLGSSLGPQRRQFSETLSTFAVIRRAFFGEGDSGLVGTGDGGTQCVIPIKDD